MAGYDAVGRDNGYPDPCGACLRQGEHVLLADADSFDQEAVTLPPRKWTTLEVDHGLHDRSVFDRSIDYRSVVKWIRAMNSDRDELFERLARSSFRRRFRLRAAEKDYLDRKGLDAVMSHGEKFIEERLAPADPANDGKQTPMRNHPIFVAQHGTATCCRGCLEKWHSISKGHALTSEEKAYILSVLRRWLISQGVE